MCYTWGMSNAPKVCGEVTSEGEFCQAPAGYGTNHIGVGKCRKHGGARKSQELDARHQLIREAATEACVKLKLNYADVTPERALQEELTLSYALVQWYTDNTDVEAAMWPAWQDMWMNERRHLIYVVKMMLDAGIAERTVRVMEAQAVMLANAIRSILDRLELNETQMRRAPMIVQEVLSGFAAATPLSLEPA